MESLIPIILDDESEEETPTYSSNPLLLQAQIICHEKRITHLLRENKSLRSQIQQLNMKLNQKRQVMESSAMQQQILKITNFIKQSEFQRESLQTRSEQEKETLRKQLQMYKQKYNQSVSANLRKTKALDKNQATTSKLQQEIKLLKTDNLRHLQSTHQYKSQISKLQGERTKLLQQNLNQKNELESVRVLLLETQQQYNIEVYNARITHTKHNREVNYYVGEIQNLHKKYEMLKEENKDMCAICYEREAILINENCGHLVGCVECSGELVVCPVCRANKTRFIRLWRT